MYHNAAYVCRLYVRLSTNSKLLSYKTAQKLSLKLAMMIWSGEKVFNIIIIIIILIIIIIIVVVVVVVVVRLDQNSLVSVATNSFN